MKSLIRGVSEGLIPLPEQPPDVPWPTEKWSRADPHPEDRSVFDQITTDLFGDTDEYGFTYALLIVKEGRLVLEKYAYGAGPFYLQYSWSIAKSVTHALVGLLADNGEIDVNAPISLEDWKADLRSRITMDQLLRMSSGLSFREDYVQGNPSDVVSMLMFDGRHDTGRFAAGKPLE